MNIIKNIKNIQNDHYSKNSTHTLIGDVYENDIVKLVPNIKNALVAKINCSTEWDLMYESELKILDYTMDKNNNYYLTGYFDKNIKIDNYFNAELSENGYTDVFIAKISYGNIVKIKFIPGLKNDKAYKIQVDSLGDIYICGYFTDSITFDAIYLSADSDNKNMFIAKIHGKTWEWIWAKSAGKNGFDAEALFVEIYNNDLYVICQFDREITFNTIPKTEIKTDGKNIIFLKMSPFNGDFKIIEHTNCDQYFQVKDVIINRKNMFLVGNFNGKISFDDDVFITENKTSFITCFNLKGKHLWFQNSDINYDNSAEKIKIDSVNNIYVLGEYHKSFSMGSQYVKTDSNSNSNGAYIMKMKMNYYNVEWIHNFQATENIILYDLELDIQNSLYIVGSFNGNMILQNRVYSGSNQTFLVKLTNNQFVISLTMCELNFNNIKLYNYNGLHLGGFVNGTYKLIKYKFDERYEKCLGIVRTPGLSLNGATVDVEFAGTVSIGYKDLNPGYDYFIQDNGEIGTNYNDFYFGTALSTDKLLLK